tara:strand:+ start:154 stop:594 length:441 start_codon:yes stop_codon:yes gene_type:complete
MRKITKEIADAFKVYRTISRGNTQVKLCDIWGDELAVYLHGNKILWKTLANEIHFNMRGWGTVTTRERLNGLFEVLELPLNIRQIDFCQRINIRPSTRESNVSIFDTHELLISRTYVWFVKERYLCLEQDVEEANSLLKKEETENV